MGGRTVFMFFTIQSNIALAMKCYTERAVDFKEKLSAVQLGYSVFDLITGEFRPLIVVTQFIDSGIVLFDFIEHNGKNRNTGTCYEPVIDSRKADFRRCRHR